MWIGLGVKKLAAVKVLYERPSLHKLTTSSSRSSSSYAVLSARPVRVSSSRQNRCVTLQHMTCGSDTGQPFVREVTVSLMGLPRVEISAVPLWQKLCVC